MDQSKKRYVPRSLLLLLLAPLVVLSTSCGSWNLLRRSSTDEFSAAVSSFRTAGAEYKDAGAQLQAGCQAGKISVDECTQISADELQVRLASRKVATLLRAWQVNGGRRVDKPKGYDEAVRALDVARNKVKAAAVIAAAEVGQ